MITVYGIRNCDTCKKVMKHFAGEAEFVDVRIEPLSVDMLNRFLIILDPDEISRNPNQKSTFLSRSRFQDPDSKSSYLEIDESSGPRVFEIRFS